MSIVYLSALEGEQKRWLICAVLALLGIKLWKEVGFDPTNIILGIHWNYIFIGLLIWSIILIAPPSKPRGI